MKILELTNFSEGACGVWQRVKQESIELSKRGYKVKIFSSNAIKDSEELASQTQKIKNIKLQRFHYKKFGGESFMSWLNAGVVDRAVNFEPDIIIAHSYRHPHTHAALKIAKKLRKKSKKCKVFLVTHAPFARDSSRSLIQKIFVNIYDFILGPKILKKFDEIIAISKWEIPYLLDLGLAENKIKYISNGIPEEFFKIKLKKGRGILFLGRVSPIKNLEVLIRAVSAFTKLNLDIVGPADPKYLDKLNKIIQSENIKNVKFLPPVYDVNSKISLIDKYKIFVLPSKSEGMPQSLIEAMVRGRIVISSDNQGSRDLIKNEQNGFLFKTGSVEDLKNKISRAQTLKYLNLGENARKSVVRFNWKKIVKDIENLF